jgi:hypothetical protein
MFRLCREFGWTPAAVRALSAVDVQRFVLILDELQRTSSVVSVSAEDDATTILITDD